MHAIRSMAFAREAAAIEASLEGQTLPKTPSLFFEALVQRPSCPAAASAGRASLALIRCWPDLTLQQH